METVASYLPQAFALIGAVFVAFYAWKYVVSPVVSGSSGLVTAAKTDFAAIETRLVALESATGIKAPSVAVPVAVGTTGAAAPSVAKAA